MLVESHLWDYSSESVQISRRDSVFLLLELVQVLLCVNLYPHIYDSVKNATCRSILKRFFTIFIPKTGPISETATLCGLLMSHFGVLTSTTFLKSLSFRTKFYRYKQNFQGFWAISLRKLPKNLENFVCIYKILFWSSNSSEMLY